MIFFIEPHAKTPERRSNKKKQKRRAINAKIAKKIVDHLVDDTLATLNGKKL